MTHKPLPWPHNAGYARDMTFFTADQIEVQADDLLERLYVANHTEFAVGIARIRALASDIKEYMLEQGAHKARKPEPKRKKKKGE